MTKAEKKKILAIIGSTKAHPTSHKIVDYIAKSYASFIKLDLYDQIDQLAHLNPSIAEF